MTTDFAGFHKQGKETLTQTDLLYAELAASCDHEIHATVSDVSHLRRHEREILDVVDRERERVSHELHDGLCQSLAGIAALSSALARKLAETFGNDLSARAHEITKLLSEAIGDARDMARGLGTAGLGTNGLDGALETLARNVQHMFRVPCTLQSDRPFPRLVAEAEVHIFRIAQESVNNAIAHGRAERIEISLGHQNSQGLLYIRDDGVGLPDDACQSDGIGLHTMACRARHLGGSIEVRRRSVQGTTVRCTFPLTPEIHDRPDSYRQNPIGDTQS